MEERGVRLGGVTCHAVYYTFFVRPLSLPLFSVLVRRNRNEIILPPLQSTLRTSKRRLRFSSSSHGLTSLAPPRTDLRGDSVDRLGSYWHACLVRNSRPLSSSLSCTAAGCAPCFCDVLNHSLLFPIDRSFVPPKLSCASSDDGSAKGRSAKGRLQRRRRRADRTRPVSSRGGERLCVPPRDARAKFSLRRRDTFSSSCTCSSASMLCEFDCFCERGAPTDVPRSQDCGLLVAGPSCAEAEGESLGLSMEVSTSTARSTKDAS